MDEDHFLAPFLEDKLPTLGLDPETYGPYLLGLLPQEEDAAALIGDEPAEIDEDEWEGVMELLQASSESHSDDLEAWQTLRTEVLDLNAKHRLEQKQKRAEVEEARQQKALEIRNMPIPEAKPEEAASTGKKSSNIDDEAKKKMLAQYAYVLDENEVEGAAAGPKTKEGDASGGAAAAVNPNKETAKQVVAASADARKEQKGATKKDEQKKTKQAKLDKVKQKEDRRNRATKGERKR